MFNGILLSAAAEGKPLSAFSVLLICSAGFFALSALFFAIAYAITAKAAKKAAKKTERAEITSVAVGKVHEQGKRQYQQDSFGVSDDSLMRTHGVLAIVADGMGGLTDGDKISSRTAEKILDDFILYSGKGTPEQLLMLLTHQAVKTVNEYLGEENYRKSGSTLVMGLIRNGFLTFASIGDSRICLWRDGELIHLNREHIYKNELLVKSVNGEIPLSDAYSDKSASGLTSYLGMGELKYVDYPASPIRLLPGDKVMLMSDGIYNAISSEEISAALRFPPAEAAEQIHAAVAAKGFTNQDNYTGVILECLSGEVTEHHQKKVRSAPMMASQPMPAPPPPPPPPAVGRNTAVPKTEQPT